MKSLYAYSMWIVGKSFLRNLEQKKASQSKSIIFSSARENTSLMEALILSTDLVLSILLLIDSIKVKSVSLSIFILFSVFSTKFQRKLKIDRKNLSLTPSFLSNKTPSEKDLSISYWFMLVLGIIMERASWDILGELDPRLNINPLKTPLKLPLFRSSKTIKKQNEGMFQK